MNKFTKMDVEVSLELCRVIDMLAIKMGNSREEVLRRAIALAWVVADGRKKGQRLVLVPSEQPVLSEIKIF